MYVVNSLKVCGIWYSKQDSQTLNTVKTVEKMKDQISKYKNHRLTLPGKVLILNTLILPLLFYVTAAFLPNEIHLKPFEKKVFSFLWEGESKRDSINRESFPKSKERGGRGLDDFFKMTEAILFNHNFL